MMERDKRVLVGLSGGIDSSAICLMLIEQGFTPVGVTMQVWGEAPPEAKEVADRLGIEHHIVDERSDFRRVVIADFINEYKLGRTPNPCVKCNPLFKFRILEDWADKLNCKFIATGHYSLLEERNGRTYLVAGRDQKKDQSYFLWKLSQTTLQRCLFPLGNFVKEEVRDYLDKKGFKHKAKAGESMEVCFINGDYRDFLKQQDLNIDNEFGNGYFVDSAGKKLGVHKGAPYYTIGQRKGLNIALGKPAYVLRINANKNTVMLGDVDQLKASYMLVDDLQLVDEHEIFINTNLTVRIRYRSKPVPCKAFKLDSGAVLVEFLEEASAITPGQSAVFYDDNRVLGGAFISSQKGINWVVEQFNDKQNA